MTPQTLIRRLERAYQVCHACGTEYGTPCGYLSTMWQGDCDVCGDTAVVTEARDYCYLRRGITNLSER
jgi:hypothetical protein